LGFGAGYAISIGQRNVCLGYKAGYNETGSDKLYIENSDATSPLIWGDFTADSVRINGDLHVLGNLHWDGLAYGTMASPSDINYKTNINPISNVLEDILTLNGVYFDWNKDTYKKSIGQNKRQIGVIAQDVEKVYPEIVYKGKDGYKSVDYTKLTAVLIEATKEQQILIESQNQLIDDLKIRVQTLENRQQLAEVR